MRKWMVAAMLSAALVGCGGQTGAEELPRPGDYANSQTDRTGEHELSDIWIDASTPAKFEEFLTAKLSPDDECRARQLKIGKGKIEGQLTCRTASSDLTEIIDVPVEISGSYTPTSIDIRSSADMGSRGSLVQERRYRLIAKTGGN